MGIGTLTFIHSVVSCCQSLERGKHDSHPHLYPTSLLLFSSSASSERSPGMVSRCVWSGLEFIFRSGDCVVELHGALNTASLLCTCLHTHANTYTRTPSSHTPASPYGPSVSSELAENLASSSLPELLSSALHQNYSCKWKSPWVFRRKFTGPLTLTAENDRTKWIRARDTIEPLTGPW